MSNKIYLAVIAALTISLLAIPLVASAQGTGDQLDSDRIKFLEDNSWDREAVDENAHFAIYVEPQMNITDEMRFIEDNLPGESHGYVIDVFYPAQPQGDMAKPDGISESDWIRFLEENFWDYDPSASAAGEADLPKVAPGLCEVIGTGCVDGEPTADVAGEADSLTAHTALCQGEDLMIPLDRAFRDYAHDVRDYCRDTAGYAGAQGDGYVDNVNQALNPY